MILSSTLFLLLIGVAMLAFPGGNLIDDTSLHYNFFYNNLSDLGNAITITGKVNTFSKIMYITAFASFGIVLIYYSMIWWAMGTDVIRMKAVGYTSKISLIICGLGFFGIAFLPSGSSFEMHMLCFKIVIISFSLWIVLILILQNTNEKLKKIFTVNILCLIIMIIYLYIILNYSKPESEDDYQFYAFAQMAAVISIAVNLFIQASGIMHFLKTSDFRRSGIRNFYV